MKKLNKQKLSKLNNKDKNINLNVNGDFINECNVEYLAKVAKLFSNDKIKNTWFSRFTYNRLLIGLSSIDLNSKIIKSFTNKICYNCCSLLKNTNGFVLSKNTLLNKVDIKQISYVYIQKFKNSTKFFVKICHHCQFYNVFPFNNKISLTCKHKYNVSKSNYNLTDPTTAAVAATITIGTKNEKSILMKKVTIATEKKSKSSLMSFLDEL